MISACTPCYPPPPTEAGIPGNSMQNIVQGGEFAEKDGWVYGSIYNDIRDKNSDVGVREYRLVKWNTNTKKIVELGIKHSANFINIINDKIIFVDGPKDTVYSCGLNGENLKAVNEYVSGPIIIDEWMYYRNYKETKKISICRSRIDGAEYSELVSRNFSVENELTLTCYYIHDGWIYYAFSSWDPNRSSLMRVKTDGTQNSEVIKSTGTPPEFDITRIYPLKDKIYFIANNKDVYSMDYDGNNIVLFDKIQGANNLYFAGDRMYYEYNQNIYSFNLTDMKQEKITSFKTNGLYVVGNQIYTFYPGNDSIINIHIGDNNEYSIYELKLPFKEFIKLN